MSRDAQGGGAGQLRIAALVGRPSGDAPPEVESDGTTVAPVRLAEGAGFAIYRYDLSLPATEDAWYRVGDERHRLNLAIGGDARIAFVSCNGQEEGDLGRDFEERNRMWRRLADEHDDAPFQLLLEGGDQIYADEVTKAHPLSENWPEDYPDLDDAQATKVRDALREAFFVRYATLYAAGDFSRLAARVPALPIWDDHDICDGWGSLPEPALDSRLGRTLFDVARETYLLFQFALRPEEAGEVFPDATGTSLSWSVALPGVTILGPDLRSERRLDRVMGDTGWRVFRDMVRKIETERVILVSSVPLLGPRLSLLERTMRFTGWMKDYEDDLRDQWQSYAHRAEWQDMLREMVGLIEGRGIDVTVISGEIHLATRGEMTTARGPMHQLVASGISHPAPTEAYPLALGSLARLGEAPLKGHKIRLKPLPGKRSIYTAERNFLVLTRREGAWSAEWELEESGRTAPLPL
ncbi:alkaline phosphatase family protein [Mesobaculum littorinae]|uniref:Alkaline phosphatase family protein n=2 Tax=Mesobaculum littorinae TaxID=2486419 RepID=A0A438AEN7_9RHOB|nr:alkaline phosphatase family protein [Mesobaculum littorinae]